MALMENCGHWMWENLIYGQFDILSLNKCSPVNAEINKSPYRFLVAHLSPRVGDERAAAASGQATGGGCVLAGGQSQLTPRRVRSVSALQPLHGQWCQSQLYSTSYLSMLNLNIIFSFSTFYLLLLYFKSQRNNIY